MNYDQELEELHNICTIICKMVNAIDCGTCPLFDEKANDCMFMTLEQRIGELK